MLGSSFPMLAFWTWPPEGLLIKRTPMTMRNDANLNGQKERKALAFCLHATLRTTFKRR